VTQGGMRTLNEKQELISGESEITDENEGTCIEPYKCKIAIVK
jgi:hypothetical protein